MYISAKRLNQISKKTSTKKGAEKRIVHKQKTALLGVVAPLIATIFIGISIGLSPWFAWEDNALSDLGHSINSEVAALFNFGLLLTGFCLIMYSITCFRQHAKYTSYSLIIAGFALQLVATFNEVYKPFHFLVSVLFFLSLAISCIIFAIEKRSVLAATAFVFGIVSWILYGLDIYSSGIAVPEALSALAVSSWVMLSAFRIYSDNELRKQGKLVF
ncbi:MAG: hypothetical protein CW716_09180 [Candidatus Bathyarchaeum sp.]|nr:MAG: hypothetical protein CW716_09180 [Candidatus Bathyarchaeum sp.]